MDCPNTVSDTLIKEISDLIEVVSKYIEGLSNQTPSTMDWATLLAAIAAVAVSVYSIHVTNVCDKKNRESNEQMAERAIRADLTAKARIEWIQNVRQSTAELITTCYKYIDSKEAERHTVWREVQERKALFVLYFGPDDDGSEEKAKDLSDKGTNKGKNDELVRYVKDLCENLQNYFKNEICHENRKRTKDDCGAWFIIHYSDSEEEKNYMKERHPSIDGSYCYLDFESHPCGKDHCNKLRKEYTDKTNKIKELNQDLFRDLQQLSEYMRIYGKIEWNRAKGGN